MRLTVYSLCLSLLLTARLLGQYASADPDHGGSLDLTIGDSGLSFGNGQDMNGIRLTFRDGGFRRVNGINLSLWVPYDNPSGEVNGITLGVLGPGAARMRGLSLGIGGVVGSESMEGINLGGLALVSQGIMTGINVGGLGLVSQGRTTGINIAGLGLVSQGDLVGVNFGGLGAVTQGDLAGLCISGLATVSQGSVSGISTGGLAVVTQGGLSGFSLAGLAIVSQGPILGLSIGGLALVGQGRIAGISFAGAGLIAEEEITGAAVTIGIVKSARALAGLSVGAYRLKAPVITGLNLSIVWTESARLTGFTVAGYNRTYELQQGLVVGIVNYTTELLGVQIGLLNIVEDNPPWARILPILNAHF